MTWTQLSAANDIGRPFARYGHGFTSVGGRLYVHGGFNGATLDDLYSFDLANMTGTLHGTGRPSAKGRAGHGFTSAGGRLYLHGGFSIEFRTFFSERMRIGGGLWEGRGGTR